MRVLVFSIILALVSAAPQGYNYHQNLGPNESGDFTNQQLQFLQQLASQQKQSNAQYQIITIADPATAGLSQSVVQTSDNIVAPLEPLQQQLLINAEEQQQSQRLQEALQIAVIQTDLPQQQIQELVQPVQKHNLPVEHPQPQLQSQSQPQSVPQPEQQRQILHPQPNPEPVHKPQPQQSVQLPSIPLPLSTLETGHQSSKPKERTKYNKDFYYLSAPPEQPELPDDFQNQLNKIRKNLRVVFIKAPEQNGIEKAVLQLTKDAQSSQTAIYVLTKQHNTADLANKLQQLPATPPQKPEVVFVKYRTPEEAEHAQRTIQSQYESIDGPNHFNYEGAIPTHNFIGSLAAIEPRQGAAKENVVKKVDVASQLNYLPPTE